MHPSEPYAARVRRSEPHRARVWGSYCLVWARQWSPAAFYNIASIYWMLEGYTLLGLRRQGLCYTSETSSHALNHVTCILINHMVCWDPWKSNCQRNTAYWRSIPTPLAAVYGTTAVYDRGQCSEHSGVVHKRNPHQTGKTYTSALWQPDQLPLRGFISAHTAAAFCFPACSYYS